MSRKWFQFQPEPLYHSLYSLSSAGPSASSVFGVPQGLPLLLGQAWNTSPGRCPRGTPTASCPRSWRPCMWSSSSSSSTHSGDEPHWWESEHRLTAKADWSALAFRFTSLLAGTEWFGAHRLGCSRPSALNQSPRCLNRFTYRSRTS